MTPAAESTFVSLPPHASWRVSGGSEKDWNTSRSSPHFAQRYSYVGIRRLRLVINRMTLALAG
jgi:hypothetical protein